MTANAKTALLSLLGGNWSDCFAHRRIHRALRVYEWPYRSYCHLDCNRSFEKLLGFER